MLGARARDTKGTTGEKWLDRPIAPAAFKEVDEGIWLASFMHYDLGYFDLEQKTLQPLDNPFGPTPLVTHVSDTNSAL